MTISILNGVAAGRNKILRNRGLADKEISAELLESLHKTFGEAMTPEQAVNRIIGDVRARGDAAVVDWTHRLDGVEPSSLAVGQEEIEAAVVETPAAVREALQMAADRIRSFHEKHKPKSWIEWTEEGALGQRITPMERVGVYVPGGSAPYPSSLLMASIPAIVAGVGEIQVATPPGRDGRIAPVILAAAKVAGVSRVFAMGGAQAIAALAFGTKSIAQVDKIVGPGGLFVTLAKKQVFGTVGIDGLYGPTETLLIADDSAKPAWVAADLLAQAEHDVLASSILITPSRFLADAVAGELEKQAQQLTRKDIIAQSIQGQGAIIVVDDLEQAIQLGNEYAPEHMCLLVREPWNWVGRVRNAGGVFMGEWTNEALGDYMIGPSHVMPTAGTARFTSALNVNDFVKITSVFSLASDQAAELGENAAALAEAEGFTAHANAIRQRMRKRDESKNA